MQHTAMIPSHPPSRSVQVVLDNLLCNNRVATTTLESFDLALYYVTTVR